MRIFGWVIMRASRYDAVTGDLLLTGLNRIRDELLGLREAMDPPEDTAPGAAEAA